MAVNTDVKITEAIDPQARVYDNYVKPAENEKSPLWDVVKSLGALNTNLQGMFDGIEKGQAEDDKVKGELAFYEQHSQGSAEAIRTDAIPAHASPTFRRAYEGAAGDTLGLQLDGKLGAAYTTSDIKSSDDPKAYDNWFKSQIKDTFGEDIKPGVARGLLPHVRQMHQKYYQQYTKDRSEYVKGVATDRVVGLTGTLMDKHIVNIESQTPEEQAATYSEMSTQVSSVYQQGYKMGLERTALTKQIVDTITAKATEQVDIRLLSLLDTVKDENGIPLSQTDHGKAQKLAYTKSIQGLIHTQETHRRQAAEREDKILLGKKTNEYMTNILKDPNWIPDAEWLKEVEKVDVDGTFKSQMANWRENVLKGFSVPENDGDILKATADAYRRGMPAVQDAMRRGVIKKPETLKSLMSAADNYDKSVGSGSPAFQHPMFKEAMTEIEKRGVDTSFGSKLDVEPGLTPEARIARDWFRQAVTDWVVKNPEAAGDPLQVSKAIAGFREDALRNLVLPNPPMPAEERPKFNIPGTPGSTNRDGTVVPPNAPPAPNTDTPVQRQAPTVVPPTGVRRLGEGEAPKIGDGSMKPDYESKIKAKAKELGVDPDFLLQRMHETTRKLRPAPGDTQGPNGKPPAAQPSTQNPSAPGKQSSLDLSGGPEQLMQAAIQQLGPIEEKDIPARMQEIAEFVRDNQLDPSNPSAIADMFTSQKSNVQVASLGGSDMLTTEEGRPNMSGNRLSEKYEVGSKGSSATIAWDSTGGWSYGRKQFASGGKTANGAAMVSFIETLKKDAPELGAKLEAAGGAAGARAGTKEFKAAWVEASKDPRFRKAEDDTAVRQLVEPARAGIQRAIGLDISKRAPALQEVLYSTAVQHGGAGATRLWKNALKGRNPDTLTDAQIINALYDERSKVNIYFKSSTAAVKKAVYSRFQQERKDALAMLKTTATA